MTFGVDGVQQGAIAIHAYQSKITFLRFSPLPMTGFWLQLASVPKITFFFVIFAISCSILLRELLSDCLLPPRRRPDGRTRLVLIHL